MIVNDYLDIYYNERLPIIIFSEKGWETYKPFYPDELYNHIINVNETICNDIIEQLRGLFRIGDVIEGTAWTKKYFEEISHC